MQRGTTGTPTVTPHYGPWPVIAGQGPFLLVWRVKDSNLGRHQPTDLPSIAVHIFTSHHVVYEQGWLKPFPVPSAPHAAALAQATRTSVTHQLNLIVPNHPRLGGVTKAQCAMVSGFLLRHHRNKSALRTRWT
jgi:hypothetical protein